MRIGLVAEVKWEVREVCRQLRLRRLTESYLLRATLQGHDIRLCLSGMIPAIAKERVERFLDETKPDLMISSGLAGALKRHIVVGDVIVQSQDPALADLAAQALGTRGLPFMSVHWSRSPCRSSRRRANGACRTNTGHWSRYGKPDHCGALQGAGHCEPGPQSGLRRHGR